MSGGLPVEGGPFKAPHFDAGAPCRVRPAAQFVRSAADRSRPLSFIVPPPSPPAKASQNGSSAAHVPSRQIDASACPAPAASFAADQLYREAVNAGRVSSPALSTFPRCRPPDSVHWPVAVVGIGAMIVSYITF